MLGVLVYQDLVPIPPIVLQCLAVAWALAAPYLSLCPLLAPVAPWCVSLLGALALAWRWLDPVGSQIWPGSRPMQCGVYGGSEPQLDPCRRAVQLALESYRPTPWLWSGDQRTAAAICRKVAAGPEELEVCRVPGARGELVVHLRSTIAQGAPIIFLLGGLAGDPTSPYVHDLQKATRELGWGIGLWLTHPDLVPGGISCAPSPSEVSDIHACLRFVRQRAPGSPVYLVGYSAGAIMLLLYCAQYGAEALCDAGAAVAGSFTQNHFVCARYRRYWQPLLTAQLKLLFWDRYGEDLPPRKEAAAASTFAELVEHLPHMGGASRILTASASSAGPSRICRPILFFASADDPFHRVDGLSIDARLPWVLYCITEAGGHTAWPEGWRADCSSFHCRMVLAFLTALGRSQER